MTLSRQISPLQATFAALLLCAPGLVAASEIHPGFDQFVTSAGAHADLREVGLGFVDLEGVDLDPVGFVGYRDGVDTIVERKQGISPFPVGSSDIVDIELVALHLKSSNPVDLEPLGLPFAGVEADLHATVNRLGFPSLPSDSQPPSIGRMLIRHENPEGGTFDSCLGEVGDDPTSCATLGVPGGGVYALLTFTTAGGDPTNPADILLLDEKRIPVGTKGGLWHHVAGDPDHFEIYGEIPCQGPHPIEPPTAVELIDFTAASSRAAGGNGGNEVVITWSTGSELDTLGFHVYRSSSPDHLGTRVNDRMVRRRGELEGASYQRIDRPGVGIFYYTLEVLDASGGVERHGPVEVRVER